ncbi:hypothetical protein ACFONG_19365 [Uliginosibacterium paludis]|uniref:Uncharacterized protein n=1 Tax=Uliginosibacterium paludis TaxID=1615952 RepID=A0ABV2CUE0_9RHOO
MLINTRELFTALSEQVSGEELSLVSIQEVGESGVQIRIDGSQYLSSIGIWPNGCCDVECICISTEKSEFRHVQVGATSEALMLAKQEIRALLAKG